MPEARQPSKPTLRKYGLTVDEWRAMLNLQGGVCAVCGTLPASGTLHIDHEHVRGWTKMEPAQRRLHVRGLLCYRDNRFFCSKGMTPARARRIAEYLEGKTVSPPGGG